MFLKLNSNVPAHTETPKQSLLIVVLAVVNQRDPKRYNSMRFNADFLKKKL